MDELGHRKYFNTGEVLRTAASMENRLEQKYARPDIFRKPARKDPATFDLLVKELADEAVFHNESHNLQKCLLIDKYSLHLNVLGSYGIGSSVNDIAEWAGIGQWDPLNW